MAWSDPKAIAFPTLRDRCVDSGHRAPSNGPADDTVDSRAAFLSTAFWPDHMGAWDAPGRQIVPAEQDASPDSDGDGDEPQVTFHPGTQHYNPISAWQPSDFNANKGLADDSNH